MKKTRKQAQVAQKSKQADAPRLLTNPQGHRLLLVHVIRTNQTKLSPYDQARFAWVVNPERAARADFVVSHVKGEIVGVFEAHEWLRATRANFPTYSDASNTTQRYGFNGEKAKKAVWEHYVGSRLPKEYWHDRITNPVRYTYL